MSAVRYFIDTLFRELFSDRKRDFDQNTFRNGDTRSCRFIRGRQGNGTRTQRRGRHGKFV